MYHSSEPTSGRSGAAEAQRSGTTSRSASLTLCRTVATDRPRPESGGPESEQALIRLVVTEGKALYADALRSWLGVEPDLEVVAALLTEQDLVATVLRTDADVVLLDLDTPSRDTAEVCEAVVRIAPDCRLIVLVGACVSVDLLHRLRERAHGLVSKHSGCVVLLDAIRRVSAGERVVDPGLVTGPSRSAHTPTARELELLRHAAHGSSVRELADRLHLSEGTVRNYLSRTMTKLGARNRIEAITIARQAGWF